MVMSVSWALCAAEKVCNGSSDCPSVTIIAMFLLIGRSPFWLVKISSVTVLKYHALTGLIMSLKLLDLKLNEYFVERLLTHPCKN